MDQELLNKTYGDLVERRAPQLRAAYERYLIDQNDDFPDALLRAMMAHCDRNQAKIEVLRELQCDIS